MDLRRPSGVPAEGTRVVYTKRSSYSPYQNQSAPVPSFKKKYSIAAPRPGQKADDFRGLETLRELKLRAAANRRLLDPIGYSPSGRYVLKIPQRGPQQRAVPIPTVRPLKMGEDGSPHGEEADGGAKRRCGVSCSECSLHFYSRNQLMRHIEAEHAIHAPMVNKEFHTQESFEEWINSLRSSHCLDLVHCSGSKEWSKGQQRISYLVCSRSGEQRQVKEKRARLARPSNKCGRTCIAFIKVRRMLVNGKEEGPITLEGCLYHSGHSIQPDRLVLADDEVDAIQALAHRHVHVSQIDLKTARSFLDCCSRLRLVEDASLMAILPHWISQLRKSNSPSTPSAPFTFPLLDQHILRYDSDEGELNIEELSPLPS